MPSNKNKSMKFRTRPFVNKRNNQVSITIPKRKLKKMASNLKADDNLFVEIGIIRKSKKKNG